MKRMLFVLILLIEIIAFPYAVDSQKSEAVFYVKAYKNNVTERGTALYITDAITTDSSHYSENLGYLGEPVDVGEEARKLDLTTSLSELLGDISSKDPSVVVFSYRVESADSGHFSVSISADGPFKNSSSQISFKWGLANVAFSTDGYASVYDESDTSDYPGNGGTLSDSWSVLNNYNSVWYRRGGVVLLIDRASYENQNAAYGGYTTKVTVTLTKD